MQPGSGPRHLTFHPNGRHLYAINELANTVTCFDYTAASGMLTERQTISTLPTDFIGKSYTADLKITPDGKFLYGTNRGHDSLAVFSVNAENGTLTALGQTPTEKTPRSFCLVSGDQFVVSAGEGSHKLIVFRRDAQNGTLTPLKTYDCGKGPAWVMSLKLN